MKASRIFIVVIIALMAVMLLFQVNAPTRFKWDDVSQSYKSKQPFGCYVMDSVLHASLPQGYEVLGDGIKKYIGKKYKGGKHTFLFTNNYSDIFNSVDVDILELIKDGNNVVLASDDFSYYYFHDIKEKLGFSFRSANYVYVYQDNLKKELSDSTEYDTVRWQAGGRFTAANYLVNGIFFMGNFELDPPFRTLAKVSRLNGLYYNNRTVAGIRDYGKGKVIVTSMPWLFTNYGILDDNIRPLALRLLSECGDLPVVRYDSTLIDKVDDKEQESESPLRYLLANRPLRWALYLALATLVAFVAFSARRRQRIIPVIKPPVNHMMDFVKRIGGIYFKRHDNVDLLNKKYVTFSNDLRVKAMIDIDNEDNIDDELLALSNRTGIPLNELQQQVSDVKDAVKSSWISDRLLQQHIDVMNDIMHRINI